MSSVFSSHLLGFAQIARWFLLLVALVAGVAQAQSVGNTLSTNQTIRAGQQLSSANKQFKAVMQSDGNFAVYREPSTYLWGTGAVAANGSVVMQGDGNVCLKNSSGVNVWCNASNGPVGDYFMLLRDNGELEVYRGTPAASASSMLVWTTALDPAFYSSRYADLKNAFGTDAKRLMDHWLTYGRFEGRAPRNGVNDDGWLHAKSVNLETMFYANKYPDLKNAFFYDAEKLYQHWMNYGRAEGRVPNKATEDFLAPAARSASGQSSMRNSDWLHVNEYLRSPGGAYIAILQNDLNFVIYQTGSPSSASSGNHRWNYNNNQATGQTGPGVLRVQTDGHFCVYKGSVSAQGQGYKCMPSGAGGPIGRYFMTLQDNGNLVIYKGAGPSDERGWIWDRLTTAPSTGFSFSAAIESVVSVVASSVTNAAVGVGNSVAQVSVSAANDLAREVTAGANLVTTTIVNTANLIADDTTRVAVTVGRTVEQGGVRLGNEIVKEGKVVGYAVANLAIDAWNYVKSNCAPLGRQAFPIAKYFQSAQQLNNNIMTYANITNQQELQAATAKVSACIEQIQDGFYCAVPPAMEKFVSKVQDMPGNLLNLSTRVFNEGKSDDCLKAGVATALGGGGGLLVCAVAKVVVVDAQKAVACFTASLSRSTVKAIAGSAVGSDSFPSQAVCNGIGDLAYQAAEKALLRDLSAELAAAAKGTNNTVAIVADQLRTVYKMAGRADKYQEFVNALNKIPECNPNAVP